MRPIIAVQYLEPGPGVAKITPAVARQRLRAAFARLPIEMVLLGWDLPQPLVSACAEEVARSGAQLYRWHPLLTGDGSFIPRREWQTVGLGGEVVPGFRGMPEFTFVCPNRPAVQEKVLEHLAQCLKGGLYQGVFLDRIRFPSPAMDPGRWLACFCPECSRAAAATGLDLVEVRQRLNALSTSSSTSRELVAALLDPGRASLGASSPAVGDLDLLASFLNFRTHSITQFLQAASKVVRAAGVFLGLDCFAPVLTRMVGQGLGELAECSDWIKVMIYAHTFAPAGMPFELLGLIDWLVDWHAQEEAASMQTLVDATRLPLPGRRKALVESGLPPQTLAIELQRARQMGSKVLLAGIELVELEGITSLSEAQLADDLQAIKEVGADGLALSWDLWHIPLKYLEVVGEKWG